MSREEKPVISVTPAGERYWIIPAIIQTSDRHMRQPMVDMCLRDDGGCVVHEAEVSCSKLLNQVFGDRIGVPAQSIRNLGYDFVRRALPIPPGTDLPQDLIDGATQLVPDDQRRSRPKRLLS